MFPWISVLVIAVLLGSIWRLYSSLRREGFEQKTKHFIVISANSQSSIEWWLRSYVFWNWIHGNACRFTCIDLGSTDDTLLILERLMRRFTCIEVKRFNSEDRERSADQLIPGRLLEQHPVVLDLRHPENRRTRSVVHDLS